MNKTNCNDSDSAAPLEETAGIYQGSNILNPNLMDGSPAYANIPTSEVNEESKGGSTKPSQVVENGSKGDDQEMDRRGLDGEPSSISKGGAFSSFASLKGPRKIF